MTADSRRPWPRVGITDLFMLSHGWNNGVDSARDLYQAMFGLLAGQLGAHRSGRTDLTASAQELWWDANGWHHNDLTAATGAPEARAVPSGYMFNARYTRAHRPRGRRGAHPRAVVGSRRLAPQRPDDRYWRGWH